MELVEYLKKAVELGGSDIFLIPGAVCTVKAEGSFKNLSQERLMPADVDALIGQMYQLAGRDPELVREKGDDDFSFAVRDLSRFRCNAYLQRGSLAAIIRIVAFDLPHVEDLHIPACVMELTKFRSGMILVTGPAGSGKSTTLACMIDQINSTRNGHIVTIEDPIEYLHRHKKSLVTQREVPNDAKSFSMALRAALRQAPDVVLLGEMRDLDTIQTAITAAETGHLLLSTLHTSGASRTVDRIIDSFPAAQQAQVRSQLALVLRAVVSQHLVPTVDGENVPVFEVMTVNPAIQNMIRDGRTHMIENAIFSGNERQGMLSMDNELQRLVRSGRITKETALSYAANPEMLAKRI